MDIVSIFSGCYNQIQRLSGLNTRSVFLPVPEAGKFKIKVVVHVVPGESCPSGLQMVCSPGLSLVQVMKEGERASSFVSLNYNPTGLGPNPVTSFNLTCRGLISKYSHIEA